MRPWSSSPGGKARKLAFQSAVTLHLKIRRYEVISCCQAKIPTDRVNTLPDLLFQFEKWRKALVLPRWAGDRLIISQI
jgi:hypothetical protein